MKRNTSRFLILVMIGTMLYSANGNQLVQVKAENEVAVESQIAEKELVIQDSSFNLDTIVEKELKDATIIKLSNSNVTVGKVILPKQVNQFLGWKTKNILDPVEEETVRYLGSKVANQTFSFEVGSQTKVRNIHFEQGVMVQIPENTTVVFENCTFQGKVENKGNSSFYDCTFVQDEMINTGKVEFLGTTKAPNMVAPEQNNPFTLEVEKERMIDGIKNVPYQENVTYQVLGMKEEEVQLNVSVTPAYMGVTAVATHGILTVSGTPKESGTIQITLTGKAKAGSEEVTKQILLVIQENATNVETGVVPSKPEGNEVNTSETTNNSTSSSSSTGNNDTSNGIGGGNTVVTPPSSGSGTQTDAVSSATSNVHNTTNGNTDSTTQGNGTSGTTSNVTVPSNTSSGNSAITPPSTSGSSTQTDAISSATSTVHKTEQSTQATKKEEIKKQNKNSKKSETKEKKKSKDNVKKTKGIYYKKISGTSFVNVLKALNVDFRIETRKKIAEANGIKNYTGTESQNAKLLELAQKGKLKQPKVVKTKKKSSKTKNVKKSTKSIKKKNK